MKIKIGKQIVVLAALAVAIQSCKSFETPNQINANATDPASLQMNQLVVPDGFKFETTQNLEINISGLDNSGKILKEIPFELYYRNKESSDSTLVLTGRTDAQGRFAAKLPFSANTGTIIAKTSYVGLPNYVKVPVLAGRADIAFGSTNNPTQKLQNEDGTPITNIAQNGGSSKGSTGGLETDPWEYMGTVNSLGVPNYLLAHGDVITQSLLDIVNASLPEGRPVPTYNPQYIDVNTNANLNLQDSSEVWITFVHEGAGYRNAVGYYTYPVGSPPSTLAGLSTIKIMFPNASYLNSGGGLRSGDKISLGHFSANTAIGFFLVPDGWNPSTLNVGVKSGKPARYTNRNLNTFTSADYRAHTVTLVDNIHEKVLIGIEDLNRPGGDNDFNDVVMFATFSTFSSLNQAGMLPTKTAGVDTDGDGVPDSQDEFPNDNKYAFTSQSPGVGQNGSLAFEDSWPHVGDYDMNDLVVDYHIEERLNATNKIAQIRYTFTVRATGASYDNGFGIELPIAASNIASVTGTHLSEHYISVASNGVEAGNQKAVIIPFDNAKTFFGVNNGTFVNTDKSKTKLQDAVVNVVVTLNQPVTRAELGSAPYNPFLIVNKERGREVHLMGYHPTEKATASYFGTVDDDTNGSTKFYQSKKIHLPWALNVVESLIYPIEKVPINQAHLKFAPWVQSGGVSYSDWYKALQNYRTANKLY